MTNEQREVIDRLEKLVRLRKSKNTIKYDNCICSTEDLDTVLSLVKEQEKEIDLMAEEIANNITNVCPREDYNYDLDCENRCSDNYKECWKSYFAELANNSIGRATDS